MKAKNFYTMKKNETKQDFVTRIIVTHGRPMRSGEVYDAIATKHKQGMTEKQGNYQAVVAGAVKAGKLGKTRTEEGVVYHPVGMIVAGDTIPIPHHERPNRTTAEPTNDEDILLDPASYIEKHMELMRQANEEARQALVELERDTTDNPYFEPLPADGPQVGDFPPLRPPTWDKPERDDDEVESISATKTSYTNTVYSFTAKQLLNTLFNIGRANLVDEIKDAIAQEIDGIASLADYDEEDRLQFIVSSGVYVRTIGVNE